MRRAADVLTLSPTDLANHLICRHLTALDLAVAIGTLPAPESAPAFTAALRARGLAHENAYIEHLRAHGLGIADLRSDPVATAGSEVTLRAMRAGVDVIVQAPLASGTWVGRADVLRRVERASSLGAWSYEPADTKLTAATKGGTILQLCTYAELLEDLQGVPPERFQVVTPGDPFEVQAYRLDSFRAYFRFVRARLDAAVADHERAGTYPEPVEHCDLCRWWERCNRQRRTDDHLSFIAGIGRVHREELIAQGFPTLAAAAAMPLPIAFRPTRGSRDTYARIREQARVQQQQRTLGAPMHELLLPAVEGQGLARLPEPSPGDLFLDLEGARFVRDGGREYLFGLWGRRDGAAPAESRRYEGLWAFDDDAERTAFEATMERVVRGLAADPRAHIYHFGHYEPTAFKRLMGRHAARAEQLDELLRGERFVDLYAIVRQALRAGVESYSIKQLEQFYGFSRAERLGDVRAHLQAIERALEGNTPGAITDETRAAVQAYNEDDCRSTEGLRDWLERLRAEVIAQGTALPRPAPKDGEASERVTALEQRQRAARERLLDGLPPEAAGPSHEQHARWLLSYLLDWHRREDKSAWWEYYRLRDLPEADLFDESSAIAGLKFVERVDLVRNARTGKPTGSVVDRYRYPVQEVDLGRKGELSAPGGERIGRLVAHDRAARTVDIRKGRNKADVHPTAVFECGVIATDVQQEALLRFAEEPHAVTCGTDLLLRRPPRVLSGAFARRPGESAQDLAVRLATDLDRTTLAIQGPPGAGKTYVGAQMIRALVRAGKKVGVTAVSHKVIRNLLHAVLDRDPLSSVGSGFSRIEGPGFSAFGAERGAQSNVEPGLQPRPTIRLAHKCDPVDDGEGENVTDITEFADNGPALAALASGEIDVLGATSWLWSRDDARDSVDVLFVDEAGQLSLANALAVSGAATSLVLLGDPQQLEQPQQGSHPDGVGISALEHVLGGASTMPDDRGLFLPTTWRLPPTICAFTSELFYEGKLQPKPGLERQCLAGTNAFDGAGLWWVPVEHDGNQNSSMEEVALVERIVDQLLATPGAQWQDEDGVQHHLTPADLRVVAPYNAQVNRLTERLAARGVPVGTVDKFQGQEAPVVIYSMATSRPEDAPRGMEFLYSLNRLNVATSRARCAAIIVGSPRLMEPSCRTPRQMLLANALCRYRELARTPAAFVGSGVSRT